MFFHQHRDLWCVVHGDDVAVSGLHVNLRWLEGVLKKELGVKTEMLGPGPQHKKQAHMLNRIFYPGYQVAG